MWFGVGLTGDSRGQSASNARSRGRADIDLSRQCGCVRKLQGGILMTAIVVLLRFPQQTLCIFTSAGRGAEKLQLPKEFRCQRRFKIAELAVGATEHTMEALHLMAL